MKISQTDDFLLANFEVEELEERLENSWGSGPDTYTCINSATITTTLHTSGAPATVTTTFTYKDYPCPEQECPSYITTNNTVITNDTDGGGGYGHPAPVLDVKEFY